MKRASPQEKTFLFPIFTASLSIVLATLSSLSLGVSIYGSDDRMDYFEVAENPEADPGILELASSIPMILKKSEWRLDGDGFYRPLTLKRAQDFFKTCPGVRFMDQPSVGYCSAFLVGEDLVASAGHCFQNQAACDEQLVAFDIQYDSDSGNPMKVVEKIPAEKVFECKTLLSTEVKPNTLPRAMTVEPIHSTLQGFPKPGSIALSPIRLLGPNGVVVEYIGPSPAPLPTETPTPTPTPSPTSISLNKDEHSTLSRLRDSDSRNFPDLSLVRLSRPAFGRKPLKMNLSGNVEKDQHVVMIGYPLGLPMKFDLNGKIIRPFPEQALYDVRIDAFSGNSGSPIIDLETKVVLGVLVMGQDDFRFSRRDAKRIARKSHSDAASVSPSPTPEPCLKSFRVEGGENRDSLREYGESVSRFSPRFIEIFNQATHDPLTSGKPSP